MRNILGENVQEFLSNTFRKGRLISYDMLQDLYSQSFEDTRVIQITRGDTTMIGDLTLGERDIIFKAKSGESLRFFANELKIYTSSVDIDKIENKDLIDNLLTNNFVLDMNLFATLVNYETGLLYTVTISISVPV